MFYRGLSLLCLLFLIHGTVAFSNLIGQEVLIHFKSQQSADKIYNIVLQTTCTETCMVHTSHKNRQKCVIVDMVMFSVRGCLWYF